MFVLQDPGHPTPLSEKRETMEPVPAWKERATLTDLLDRVLDKGLVINADIMISLAGIPLIGVNLKAVIAGVETMLKYGMLEAWDSSIRAWEKKHRAKPEKSLVVPEEKRV